MQYWQRKLQRSVTDTRRSPISRPWPSLKGSTSIELRLPCRSSMTQPPRTIHLDELESIPGPGSLTWRPVRATLGIRAFGCNAYTAAKAGDDVVEPHTEDPALAQEELYFVANGRATFTIDGAEHDAPAGTYVFIPDPASHRHAVAAEPQTTVLSFGGPPTFEPSAWEWAFRAAPLMRTDPSAGTRDPARGPEGPAQGRDASLQPRLPGGDPGKPRRRARRARPGVRGVARGRALGACGIGAQGRGLRVAARRSGLSGAQQSVGLNPAARRPPDHSSSRKQPERDHVLALALAAHVRAQDRLAREPRPLGDLL